MRAEVNEVNGGVNARVNTCDDGKGPLTCDDAAEVNEVNTLKGNFAHAPAHMRAHTRTRGHNADQVFTRSPRSPLATDTRPGPTPVPAVRGGRATTSDGVHHVLRVARPHGKTAKRYGLNPNHEVRVWCECMAQQKSSPGELPSGPYWTGATRTQDQIADDPRRLGGWDWLGVADTRVSNSVIDIFRAHLREVEERHARTD